MVTDFLDAAEKTGNRNLPHKADSCGTMADLGGFDLGAVADRLEASLAASKKHASGRELSTAAGLSKGQFHATIKQLRGGQGTNITTLVALATALEISLPWLLTGQDEREPRLMDLPNWSKVAADTAKRRPLVPDFAIAHVGTFVFPNRPELDVTFVGDLARAWFEAASEELRSRVETEYVRAKMRP